MAKKKKTTASVFPIPIPKEVRVGNRFILLNKSEYVDKTFPAGSQVTYLGRKLSAGYTWPRFQFDGDNHKERILDFTDLKPI